MADTPPRLQVGLMPNLRYDLPAGLVVFLVALPLCLGIALASEAPLMSGVISGAVAGLLVAPLSGSQLSVSGPAAGLTTIVAGGIATLGSFEALLAAALWCGIIQLALGVLRLGGVASLFPVSVVKGMLAAIGIILVLKQIPHALGRDRDYVGDLDFWLLDHAGEHSTAANTFTELLAAFSSASPGAIVLSAAALGLLLLWDTPWFARQGWTRVVPGALVAVLSGLVINKVLAVVAPGWEVTGADGHLVQLPVLRSPSELSGLLAFPDIGRMLEPAVMQLGLTLAIIASVETLLSLEAADKLDPFRRVSDPNRELVAQGVGNVVAPLLGGLPMTSVIVRSSTNAYAGARTWRASFVHGLLLVVMAFAAPGLLNRIPLASLAAVLLLVGWKLAKPALFRSMWRAGFDQFAPFLVTVVVTVLTDLLVGVVVGTIVGMGFVILTNKVSAVSVVHDEGAWLVQFTTNVSFLNKGHLKSVFASIPDGAEVVIDGRAADFIDRDIYDAIEDFKANASFRGISVEERALGSKAFPFLGRRNPSR